MKGRGHSPFLTPLCHHSVSRRASVGVFLVVAALLAVLFYRATPPEA
jgi:hypothetical protein